MILAVIRKERCLIYPLMKGGSLEDRLMPSTRYLKDVVLTVLKQSSIDPWSYRRERLDCATRLNISIQIARAVAYLHQSGLLRCLMNHVVSND